MGKSTEVKSIIELGGTGRSGTSVAMHSEERDHFVD